jgi:hypothetical protein
VAQAWLSATMNKASSRRSILISIDECSLDRNYLIKSSTQRSTFNNDYVCISKWLAVGLSTFQLTFLDVWCVGGRDTGNGLMTQLQLFPGTDVLPCYGNTKGESRKFQKTFLP